MIRDINDSLDGLHVFSNICDQNITSVSLLQNLVSITRAFI
jgi:hypothetical protein